MYTAISNAVALLGAATGAIRQVLKKATEKYFTSIDNMFLYDDILDHENF